MIAKLGILLVGVALLGTPTNSQTSQVSCLDENGQPVDSWTAIKASNSMKYYVYNEAGSTWDVSPYFLNQTSDGCIMATAAQLYGSEVISKSVEMYVGIYNDEPSDGTSVSSTYAHAKGILAASVSEGAFWLVHSMPQWPDLLSDADPGVFPSSTYAQSLTCVTVTASTADVIAANLMISRPFIYTSLVSDDEDLAETLPNMLSWLQGNHSSSDVTSNVSTISSAGGGFELTQFEKVRGKMRFLSRSF